MSEFLDETDRALIAATQEGLPLVPQPYHHLARHLGISPAAIMSRLQHLKKCGILRRIGVIPNHYHLGYRANGMTVWDVDDQRVMLMGDAVGGLPFVTHCYIRPRIPDRWPYNLFAMVHGHNRKETDALAEQIRRLLGSDCRQGTVLYSTRILKKTGLRLTPSVKETP